MRYEEQRALRDEFAALSLDTPGNIARGIEIVRLMADDEEVAHAMEDQIHVKVLEAVVQRKPEALNMAALALTTRTIEFPRYCA